MEELPRRASADSTTGCRVYRFGRSTSGERGRSGRWPGRAPADRLWTGRRDAQVPRGTARRCRPAGLAGRSDTFAARTPLRRGTHVAGPGAPAAGHLLQPRSRRSRSGLPTSRPSSGAAGSSAMESRSTWPPSAISDSSSHALPVTETDRRARGRSYVLADGFLRFWFRYVFPFQADLEAGLDPASIVASEIEPTLADHLAPAIEEVARGLGQALRHRRRHENRSLVGSVAGQLPSRRGADERGDRCRRPQGQPCDRRRRGAVAQQADDRRAP